MEKKTKTCRQCSHRERWQCGGNRCNVGRCCRENEATTLTKSGKVNDNHRYLGFRWYFESDNKWTLKIKR